MKEIILSSGEAVMVDEPDFEWLNQFKWHLSGGYVSRTPHGKRGQNQIRMHREIMGEPKDMEVDHEDLNRFNCQRYNLRICTRLQNARNVGVRKNNSTGFKGVGKFRNKWRARINIEGKLTHLGLFNLPEEAAKAYNNAAIQHHGEFANLNEGIV